MPTVRVKGVQNAMQFPDDMDINDIRSFLQRRFANQAVAGNQSVNLTPRQPTIQASNPSLATRAAQGIGNALTSSGLISDNASAQEIGKNVTNIAAFSPLGAAFGGDEFGTAAKEGDKFGMALGALEGVGIGGDIAKLAIFGGVLAKTADLGALNKAQKLESGGAGRDEVWKETGWFNDKGDWKFEISDYLDFDNEVGADINPSSFQMIKDFGGTTQENFMGHPELYGAYPNLKDRPIRSVAGSGGQYNTGTDVVSIGDKLLSPTSGVELSNTQSVNLHELQHAIQQREKFAGGGSPTEFELTPKLQADSLKQWGDISVLKRLINGRGEDLAPSKFETLIGRPPSEMELSLAKSKSFDDIAAAQKNLRTDPVDKYERLAGEAEARNVQTRMDLTPQQRRDNPPWKTLDVPEDELIYRKSGKDKATK
jgi:hypothetical protein